MSNAFTAGGEMIGEGQGEHSRLVGEEGGERLPGAKEYGAATAIMWLTLAVQVLGGSCLALVVVWFGKYDNGYSWATGNPAVFSWHPTLMTMGMLVCFSNAAISYRSFSALSRPSRKLLHGTLNFLAWVFLVIGLRAVFRFHDEKLGPDGQPAPIKNMYSLHSWLGLSTAVVFSAQFLIGFVSFAYPKLGAEQRTALVPKHALAGSLILVCLVASTVSTGVLEKMTFGGDCNKNGELTTKCVVANLFGMFSVALIVCTACIVLYPAKVQRRD